jgi:hypothetical protein
MIKKHGVDSISGLSGERDYERSKTDTTKAQHKIYTDKERGKHWQLELEIKIADNNERANMQLESR